MTKYIIDLSHHQPPKSINYDELAKQVDWVIIRTQYGSATIDRHYKTHHKEFQKRGIPTAAYAWVRGVSIKDMEKEATDFYNRTKEFNPTFWWLDVEEQSMKDMRSGVSAYIKKLRQLGAKKVGIYIANHLYERFNLNVSEADAIWIPRYSNDKPNYPHDLWQYTDKGKLKGFNGHLDLNKLSGNKPLSYFTNKKTQDNNDIDKGGSKLFRPSANEMINAVSIVLNRLSNSEVHGDKAISKQWRQKLLDGTLTDSDAIALLYVAFERGLFIGDKK